MNFSEIRRELEALANEEKAVFLQRFFKTGPGEYGDGDKFLGMQNTPCINNWDLVDISAEHITGAYLLNRSKKTLYNFARSGSLWERRIAGMATFHYIKRGDFTGTLKISRMLLTDKEDLIHKAVGWMLREIGKRNPAAEQEFLNKHCKIMPRTMLRYAIEKFPEQQRKMYLRGEAG